MRPLFAPAAVVLTSLVTSGIPSANTVNYPLRHSFSMAPGIEGAQGRDVTSCWEAEGDDYDCRIVAGIEEVGDKRNWLVYHDDALSQGYDSTYGYEVVDRDGWQYEGCAQWRNGDWFCDYQTRNPVSRTHYQAGHWVLRTAWSWKKYAQGQVGCAVALSGFWGGASHKAFLALLNDCLNGPMEPMERPS